MQDYIELKENICEFFGSLRLKKALSPFIFILAACQSTSRGSYGYRLIKFKGVGEVIITWCNLS